MSFWAWFFKSTAGRCLAMGLVGGAIAGTGMWHLGNLKLEAAKGDWAAKQAQEARKAADAIESAWERANQLQKEKDDAVNQAQVRAIENRRAAASLRTERDGLRNDLAELRERLASDSCQARAERADALAELFDQCSGAVEDLASKAQGHANDALMLYQAWPGAN